MRTKSFVLLLLPLLSATCVYGQGASKAVSAYFDVLKTQDYDSSAALFDPGELREFREMMSFIGELPADEQEGVWQALFGPSASRESVSKLSDSEFFASFLRTVMAQADAAGGVNFDALEILGEVTEGPDVVHVVTRNKVSVGEIEMEAMEVVSVKKEGEGWKLLLSGKMKGMASQMKAAFGQSTGE